VGTAAELAERARDLAPDGVDVEVAWNPEFLREGFAVHDTLHPDRIVLGVQRDSFRAYRTAIRLDTRDAKQGCCADGRRCRSHLVRPAPL
jgi:UDP-glucose 6-dehydrogenase